VNKTLLIFRHEFATTIKRTGFIILTLALPVLALLAIGIIQLVSATVKPPTITTITSIGYVDEEGTFNQFTTENNIKFVPFTSTDTALQSMDNGNISDYFIIPANYSTKGIIENYTLEKQLSIPTNLQSAIQDFLTSNLLANKVPAATIQIIESPLNIVSTRLTTSGAVSKEQGGPADIIVPGLFGIFLALSLIFSSTYILQGLGEEKENRIMEILLSSVSARQIIIGKVLGIGAAGLIQVMLWVISIPLLLKLASSSIGGFISSIHIPANFMILGIVYFILGYLLFAVLSSCIASVSGTIREGQGLSAIYTIFAIVPLWFLSLLLLVPNSPIWVILSIFPFSAPVEVMLRYGITGIPPWQVITSIAVLILSIIGGLRLSANLLRTYTLMYGKRPSPGEIIRSFTSH
jgi:ABC-2 type transport system permease protein